MKTRLDAKLVQLGLAPGRDKAKAIIMAGIVYVNGQKADKAGTEVTEKDKIELHGDISIPFLKKSRFTGSFKGMRYVLIKHENEVEPAAEETPAKTETVIRAIIWPEPVNFEVTPDEKKHHQDFPFTTDGIWEAVDWLNAEHEAGHF